MTLLLFGLFLLGQHGACDAASMPWIKQSYGGPCPVPDWRRMDEREGCFSYGRQRAIVKLDRPANSSVGCVSIPWRRRDDPGTKGIFVVDERNVTVATRLRNTSNIVGELCFQLTAAEVASEYAIHYPNY